MEPGDGHGAFARMVLDAPARARGTFCDADRPHRLALLIVEPREHAFLDGVLRQVAHVYRALDGVSLTVVHGPRNRALVAAITALWDGTRLVECNAENLPIEDYNDLMCDAGLWDLFQNASHVLVFQTDAWIFRPVPDVFFGYAYVGAPWEHTPRGCRPRVGGNGGLSLRRVSDMRAICRAKHRRAHEPEDVFFCRHLRDEDVCPFDLALTFSAEHVWLRGAAVVGFHRAHEYLGAADFREIVAASEV